MKLMVIVPTVKTWMEQRCELSCFGVYRSDVAAFEPVADGATQREILCAAATSVLHGDHVIDFVFQEGEPFRNSTVLAEAGSPGSHEFSKRGVDIRHRPRDERVLAGRPSLPSGQGVRGTHIYPSPVRRGPSSGLIGFSRSIPPP